MTSVLKLALTGIILLGISCNSHAVKKEGINAPDSLTTTEKLSYLKSNNVSLDDKKDTQCGICSARCCSPCFQDGDYTRCVQTRFKECSICGHVSDRHVAVDHMSK